MTSQTYNSPKCQCFISILLQVPNKYIIHHSTFTVFIIPILWCPLPERAPSDIALAKILVASSLHYQQVHLLCHLQTLLKTIQIIFLILLPLWFWVIYDKLVGNIITDLFTKVSARKFVSNSLHNIKSFFV